MRLTPMIVGGLMAVSIAGPVGAWQWSNSEEALGDTYRIEAGFQPGYVLSRRADQDTYWGDIGWKVSRHSVIGLLAGYFGPARAARQVHLTLSDSGGVIVNTTTVQEGDNRFYFLGPFYRRQRDVSGLLLYCEAGSGPAIQKTRTTNKTTDHLNGNSVRFVTRETTNLNASVTLALGVDVRITENILVGLGLRDLLVIRRSDPDGYPEDNLRPLNNVIPFASFRFRY